MKKTLLYSVFDELGKNNTFNSFTSHLLSVLKKIFATPGITRKSLITLLDIRPGTVSEITAKLLEDNLIHEKTENGITGRGRPEIPLYCNYSGLLAIAISCSACEIHAYLVNMNDEVLFQTCIDIPKEVQNNQFEESLHSLVQTSLDYGKNFPDSKIIAISMSIPGVVDSTHKRLLSSARWPNLKNVFLSSIETNTKIPFSIKRQLDLRLEHKILTEKELKNNNVLLFHWGYGIGGAFASKGEVISSNIGVFCQIGHVPVNSDSIKPCICGQIGCLEADAAYWALEKQFEDFFGDLSIKNEIDAALFFQEKSIIELPFFRKALISVSQALSNILCILVPDTIILYGMFFKNPDVRKALLGKVKQVAPPYIFEKTDCTYIDIENFWDIEAIVYADFKNYFASYFSSCANN